MSNHEALTGFTLTERPLWLQLTVSARKPVSPLLTLRTCDENRDVA